MARDFTKNTSNYMSLGINALGPLLHGAAAISAAMLVQVDSLVATANQNRFFTVFSGVGTTGFTFLTDAASHLRVGGRSFAEGFLFADSTTTIATSGANTYLGGVMNIAADTITPYLNGVAEGAAAAAFSQATWENHTPTSDHDSISGNGAPPSATDQQTDGRIEYLAMWTIDIGATAFANLAKGWNPSFVHATKPVFYMRLGGVNSPETSIISNITGTITGSLPAAASLAHSPTRGGDRLTHMRQAANRAATY